MKKIIALAGITALIVGAGIFFFFYRMYQNDVKTLTAFPAAYEKFNQAAADFSGPVLAGAPAADDLERKADEALAGLNARASTRLSSLIKNDAEVMDTMLKIADLSGKEFDALKTYQKMAAEKGNLDGLAKEVGDLRSQRQTAYARFRELGPQ
jgi:hypothetical protein